VSGIIILAKSDGDAGIAKYKRIIVSCERNLRDNKKRGREDVRQNEISRGEIKMLGCHEDTGSSAYLFIPLQKLVFQRASERRRINAPLLRAIALALRKFAATQHPCLRFVRTNENYIAR